MTACGGPGSSPSAPVDVVDDAGDNTPPVVTIESPSPNQTVNADQGLDFVGSAFDAEDSPTALTAAWSSDTDGTLFTETLNAAGVTTFSVDGLPVGTHIITLAVTDSQGLVGEAKTTLHVVISETVLSVSIAPEAPTTSDALTATVLTPVEEDVTVLYQWLKNGEDSGLEGPTLAAQSTAKGETWAVVVTAIETGGHGEDAVTVLNTPPTCTQVTLLPQAAPSNEARICTCTQWSDPDIQDTSQDTCVFVDTEADGDGILGAEETDNESCTLQPDTLIKGMQVVCTLTPHDGEEAGTSIESDPSSVMNSAPTEPSEVAIEFVGDEATLQTLLTCTYQETATDSDGDDLVYQVSWVVDGTEYPGHSETVVLGNVDLSNCDGCTPPVVDSAVMCRVRACEVGDGACSAPIDSDPITLGNLPPTGGSALLGSTPEGPVTEASTVECLATGAVDPEGAAINWTFAWEIQAAGSDVFETVVGATQSTLTGADFDKGDTIRCVATPVDEQGGAGDAVTSKQPNAVVVNTLPSLTDVSLYPDNPTRQDTLICAFTWADPDPADSVAVEVAWLVQSPGKAPMMVLNAFVEVGADTSVAASLFLPGDEVWCELTPKNGSDSGAVVNSNAVTIINQPPTAPGIALTVPTVLPGDGSFSDDVHCQVVSASTDADWDTVTVSFQMSINGVVTPNQNGTIASSLLSHCDRITCVATADDGWPGGVATSAEESGQLAAGSDCPVAGFCEVPTCKDTGGCGPSFFDENACDDGLYCNGFEACDLAVGCLLGLEPHQDNNPCTVDVCYEASDGVPGSESCVATNEGTVCNTPDMVSQNPCDDGDPCTPIDLCVAGECLPTSESLCIEERLSVTHGPLNTPTVTPLALGRYATYWQDWQTNQPVLRVTDANGSRLNEEASLDVDMMEAAVQARVGALPGGKYWLGSVHYLNKGTGYDAVLRLFRYALDGSVEATSDVVMFPNVQVPAPGTRTSRNIPLRFQDNSLGVVEGGTYGGIRFAPVDNVTFEGGDWEALVPSNATFQRHAFDAEAVHTEDGMGNVTWQGFRMLFVGKGTMFSPQRLRLNTYDSDGKETANWPDSALNIGSSCIQDPKECVDDGMVQADYNSSGIGPARMTILSNGDTVVVWSRVESNGYNLMGRVFGSDGSYKTGIIPLLSDTSGNQRLVNIAAFSDDQVVMVYEQEESVRYRFLDPANLVPGDPGGTVHVKQVPDNTNPDVAVFPGPSGDGTDDEWVVTFIQDEHVFTRRLHRDGTPVLGIPERRANMVYDGDQLQAAGASARPATGQPKHVMTTYRSQSSTTSKERVWGRLFSHTGDQISPERPLTSPVFHADGFDLAGGGTHFVMTYGRSFNVGDDLSIKARFYNGLGVELNDPDKAVSVSTATNGDQSQPTVAVRPDHALIAWQGNEEATNYTIYGRLFDLEGDALTDPFHVNQKDTGKQWEASLVAHPTLDRYAMVWTSNHSGSKDVRMRVLDVNDNAVSFATDELSVHKGIGQQEHARVAMAPNNQVVVCYEWSGLGVGDEERVACKLFDWAEGTLYVANNDEPYYPYGSTTLNYRPDVAWLQASGVAGNDFAVAYESNGLDPSEGAIQLQRYNTNNGFKAVDARVVINRQWFGNQARPFVVNASVGSYWVGWDATPESGSAINTGSDVYFRVFPTN